MRINTVFLSLLLFTLMSCDENGNGTIYKMSEQTRDGTGSAIIVGTKSIFARWRNTAVFQTAFDFTGEEFKRSFTTVFNIDTLTTCDCFVYVTGNESLGSMRISQCFNRAGNYEAYDCKELEGYINYSKTTSDLRLTCYSKALCGTYR